MLDSCKAWIKSHFCEILKFCIVGAINAIILMGLYNLLLYVGVHYFLANAIAFVVSVLNAYLLNKFFVFKNKDKKHIKNLIKIFLVYFTSLVLGSVLLIFYIETLNLAKELGPLINIFIFTPFNFILCKYWALRRKNKMRIILVGASGNLGKNLLKHFEQNGHEVLCIARKGSILSTKAQILYLEDDNFERHFMAFGADTLFHAAGNYGKNGETAKEMIESNVVFGVKMIELAKKAGVKKLFLMSTALDSDVSYYAMSKEQLSQWAKLLWNKEQLFDIKSQMLYGENFSNISFMSYVFDKCSHNENIDLTDGSQKRDILYIEDMLSAVDLLLLQPCNNSGLIELGYGKSVSIKDIVQYVKSVTGSKSTFNFGAVKRRDREPEDMKADIQYLSNLGWTPQFDYKKGIDTMQQKWRSK